MQALEPVDYDFLSPQQVRLLAAEKEPVSTIMPNRTEHGGLRGSGLSQGQAETPRKHSPKTVYCPPLPTIGSSLCQEVPTSLTGIYFLAGQKGISSYNL
jgi:hypothetical protein